MPLKYWSYIFISPGFDPRQHRIEMVSPSCKAIMIGLDPSMKEEVISIAKSLVEDGIQLIELCGGFGPIWIARIIEATQGKIPVGGTFYGPEARIKMVQLTSPIS